LVSVKHRTDFLNFCEKNLIEAKVHYPLPLHLQKAAEPLGYKLGDFPVAEQQANEVLTIPAHQHVSVEQLEFIISKFREFARMMER
jgi:dTDP-4-amino-4,6-dideoxygalactose transaminase